MVIPIIIYLDNGILHFVGLENLESNLLDCAGELLKNPTKNNIETVNMLLDLVTYINHNQEN